MESVQGRDTDIIVTPSGNRLIVHFFTGILEYFSEVTCFQVLQQDDASILVRVVPGSGFSADTASRIVSTLHARGAHDMRIEVEPVAAIPVAPSGKRRFVIGKAAASRYARSNQG
jgi:phenylacetate-CoA ligase